MNFVWRHIALCLFVLAIVMLLGFAAGGATGLFAAMAAWLGLWLATQLYYVLKLAHWLESPKINTIPHVGGMWSTIFDTLLRQAKNRKKRKQKLSFNHWEQRLQNLLYLTKFRQKFHQH